MCLTSQYHVYYPYLVVFQMRNNFVYQILSLVNSASH